MRSLNTSLPRSSPRPQPTEQLLQSFKTAALSVTNLYKNAVYEQNHARNLGYQEAIEDLLNFLDRENLGLGDGEGWKVRQWATEKSDGTGAFTSDDDERPDSEKRTRSTSPMVSRKEQPKEQPEPESGRQPSTSISPRRDEHLTQPQPQPQSQPAPQQQSAPVPSQTNEPDTLARPTIFTFSAGPQYPAPQQQDVDMQTTDDPSSQEDAAVNISVLPRNLRQTHRHNNHSRTNQRTSTRDTSVGLGSKRKFNLPDFFDLSGLGNGRDMFGGGKRGRFA